MRAERGKEQTFWLCWTRDSKGKVGMLALMGSEVLVVLVEVSTSSVMPSFFFFAQWFSLVQHRPMRHNWPEGLS